MPLIHAKNTLLQRYNPLYPAANKFIIFSLHRMFFLNKLFELSFFFKKCVRTCYIEKNNFSLTLTFIIKQIIGLGPQIHYVNKI